MNKNRTTKTKGAQSEQQKRRYNKTAIHESISLQTIQITVCQDNFWLASGRKGRKNRKNFRLIRMAEMGSGKSIYGNLYNAIMEPIMKADAAMASILDEENCLIFNFLFL